MPGTFESTPMKNCTKCPSPSVYCGSETDFFACMKGYYAKPITGRSVSCTACPNTGN